MMCVQERFSFKRAFRGSITIDIFILLISIVTVALLRICGLLVFGFKERLYEDYELCMQRSACFNQFNYIYFF